MNVFVTGGFGFLGSRVVEELKEQGCTPSCSARRLNTLTPKDLEGFDVVIHSAGLKSGAHTAADLKAVNADGTRHLVEACRKAGVRRFVHISTTSVDADSDDAYSTSKREAERHVQASALRWTILRPSAIYGPSEWWISYFRVMRQKRLVPVIGDGEYPIQQIYVKDCARAIVEAVGKETSGRIYTLSAKSITYNHYLSVLKTLLRADFKTVHVSMWLARLYAAGMTHVLRSPRPQYNHDPRHPPRTSSAMTLDCPARTFELGLAETLSEIAAENLRRSQP